MHSRHAARIGVAALALTACACQGQAIAPGPAKTRLITDYMRQLRPGYLRPLTHVGFGGKPISDQQVAERIKARLASKAKPTDAFFRRVEAADAADHVVWCHTADLWARPAWMDRDRAQVLAGVRAFYCVDPKSANGFTVYAASVLLEN